MTRRRWIADQWDESSASIQGQQAAHLIRVLRAQPGMEFDIVAGGRVWHAAIAAIHGDEVAFTLLSEIPADPALPVTLLLSIFKFDRMEWILEKATELGAERFVPIAARRSEKHLVQAAAARSERWRRIVREAAKQSRRSDVPLVDDLLTFNDAVRHAPGEPPVLRLVLAEQERERTLRAALADAFDGNPEGEAGRRLPVVFAVGPEGGWTGEEDALFAAQGWIGVTLGPRILRVETAAVVGMALVAAFTE